ncbi:MAG: hypothetical protein HY919_06360 [Elusimicrobia bacterium]|nr:hypothetical protein [Elusimicrobiota bacterium]
MAIVNTLRIYEILRPKLQDEPAKAVAEAIEESFEEYQEHQSTILATKVDLAETKAELIKWMFIFWVGQIGVLTGILLAFFKR